MVLILFDNVGKGVILLIEELFCLLGLVSSISIKNLGNSVTILTHSFFHTSLACSLNLDQQLSQPESSEFYAILLLGQQNSIENYDHHQNVFPETMIC
jgi:hypothetical protein